MPTKESFSNLLIDKLILLITIEYKDVLDQSSEIQNWKYQEGELTEEQKATKTIYCTVKHILYILDNQIK
jgi:hypothetical protein